MLRTVTVVRIHSYLSNDWAGYLGNVNETLEDSDYCAENTGADSMAQA
jgi:hypothetical protein